MSSTCKHGYSAGHWEGGPDDQGFWCHGPGEERWSLTAPRVPVAEVKTSNDQALAAALGIDLDSDSMRLATAIAAAGQYGTGIALLSLVTDLRDLVRFYDSSAKVVYADSLLAAVDSALEWLYDQDSARAKALAKQPKP